MTIVKNKISSSTVEDPVGGPVDPWADFREIEIIGLEWTQSYKHSLGKYSKFFLALEEGKFLATTCPPCNNKTFVPPRPACPDCLLPARWVELSGRGQLISWSVLHYAPKMLADKLQTPYVLAYVKLDGADTLFAHLLTNTTELRYGMPVKVVYSREDEVDHPIMLFSFEPDNDV
ncbi:MAG: Zn-ribbon domain-containing OB-fold protein [Chloroflexota bacterium]